MDIDEFQKQQQPRAKKSKLEPFINEIRELKENGYANWQVREWLASNDVTISLEGFRKFWIKAEKQGTPETPKTTARQTRPASFVPSQGPIPTQPEPDPSTKGLTRKQIADRVGDQYVNDNSLPENSFIKRLREKEQQDQEKQ